ncbi:MAG: pyrroline-5-carboxylate reductase [Calditrichia bacterium]
MFKIAIIGCGSMGSTYARSFLQFNLVTRENLLLVAKDAEQNAFLQTLDLGMVSTGMDASIEEQGVIIIAVKPQNFSAIVEPLKKHLKPHHLVLSIMAGIRLETLQESLEHAAIIRAMPNTPAQLGMGVTAFSAIEGVNIHQISIIDNLLSTTGRTLFLDNEALLDSVTALSGSGPAYFYYIVKHMIDAGREMGLEESVAAMLVKQTMLGSFHLMNQSPKSLDELIGAVASKGGTTEAALSKMEEEQCGKSLADGILAAEKRAKELSKGQ